MSFNENEKDNELQNSIAYRVMLEMKEKDVNASSWILIILTFATGIAKLFTDEYNIFFKAMGKSIIITDSWIGAILIFISLLFMISLKKPKIKNVSIKRLSIIATTCVWTYLLFEYLMLSIFINIGITWITIVGIIGICFYVMTRGDYD